MFHNRYIKCEPFSEADLVQTTTTAACIRMYKQGAPTDDPHPLYMYKRPHTVHIL